MKFNGHDLIKNTRVLNFELFECSFCGVKLTNINMYVYREIFYDKKNGCYTYTDSDMREYTLSCSEQILKDIIK